MLHYEYIDPKDVPFRSTAYSIAHVRSSALFLSNTPEIYPLAAVAWLIDFA
jgi:hypothetical protein